MASRRKPVQSESDNSSDPDYEVSPSHHRTKSLPKDQVGLFVPNDSFVRGDLDPDCVHTFDNTLVRIEYPGRVKNIDKAIETLGGIAEIQKALDGKELELSFHPKSQYIRGCVANVGHSVGFLLKVRKDQQTKILSYEVVGAVDTTFKFVGMCDFQYLPLLPKDKPECKESDVEYIHGRILLEEMPTLDWFAKSNPVFLTCSSYARFNQPQRRFESHAAEVLNATLRKDAAQLSDFAKKNLKAKANIITNRISLHKIVEIPTEPPPDALDNINSQFLQTQLKLVQELFELRPIWTKPAVLDKTKMHMDTSKLILPCVAYYCNGGPWRTCWIKFGYNPCMDINSRIYQALDFRVRHTEGMQLKVKAKRSANHNVTKTFAAQTLSELHYTLRPNQVPLARQMIYQYCDILLPEVQDMLANLPKLPASAQFDANNGWMPLNFKEQCREIVNRYCFDAVQQEMLKEIQTAKPAEKPNIATYCSKMLSNIKKGVTQSMGEYPNSMPSTSENIVEHIDLSDEEIDVNDIMNTLPEKLPNAFEEEADFDSDSDFDIDMEIVDEVNELVAGIKDKNLS